MRKIATSSDHAGFELKEFLKVFLKEEKYEVIDLGTDSEKSVDYPYFGKKLGEFVVREKIQGIVVCGTGIGISIAANKVTGVRAANCINSTMAKLAREHNNANVLGLGSRIVGTELAKDIVNSFLETDFMGERHSKRVRQIE